METHCDELRAGVSDRAGLVRHGLARRASWFIAVDFPMPDKTPFLVESGESGGGDNAASNSAGGR